LQNLRGAKTLAPGNAPNTVHIKGRFTNHLAPSKTGFAYDDYVYTPNL